MNKKVLWSERKKEIKYALKKMLSGVRHSISVWRTRLAVRVYVCYEDFVTEEQMTALVKSIAGDGAEITILRTYSKRFTEETLYGLFSSGETGILYRDGESVEAAPIRRYVGRMMSGISRGESPANFLPTKVNYSENAIII